MDDIVTHSSERFGRDDTFYGVTKFRDNIRKQWALTVETPGVMEIAAYFRSEADARQFAEVLRLTITEARRG